MKVLSILRLVFYVYFIFIKVAACDLFTTMRDIKVLSDLEEKHLGKLENHLKHSEERLKDLKRLLAAIKPEQGAISTRNALDVAGHPVSAYHVVKTWHLLNNLTTLYFRPPNNECVDKHENCAEWAKVGECSKNPAYMLVSCALSCGTCSNSTFDAGKDMKEILDDFGQLIPTEDDVNGSVDALIRLQVMYNLTVKDLADGVIRGRQSSSPICAQQCFDIGLHVAQLQESSLAAEWFEEAKNRATWLPLKQTALYHMAMHSEKAGQLLTSYKAALEVFRGKEPDFSCADMETSCETFFKSNLCASNIHKAQKVCPLSCGFCEPKLQRVLFHNELVSIIARTRDTALPMIEKGESQEILTPNIVKNYKHLCSSNILGNSSLYTRKNVFCKFYTNTVTWYPFKLEVLSVSPFVSVVYDAISDKEAHYFQSIAKSKLIRSEVALSETGTRLSKDRISKQCWMKDHEDPVVARITKRIEAITGLNLSYQTTVDIKQGRLLARSSDSLQILNYGIGGHYDVHHDFLWPQHLYPHLVSDSTLGSGDRIATFMLYLNEVVSGGNTIFPKLNISITPVKNAAAFWYNASPSGEYEYLTLHGGCPVLLGEKWVANKWTREIGNEFTRKCGFHKDSLQNV